MSVYLTLHTGTIPNSWSNPNVWVVPGPDPQGQPGSPQANQDNWCWANVVNAGTDGAQVTVQWYWCKFNAQTAYWKDVLANDAGFTSFPLNGGGTARVYSNAPWRPTTTGHTCIVAVASAPTDSFSPNPNDPFDPNDRHVAQQNITVVSLGNNLSVVEQEFALFPSPNESTVRVQRVEIALLAPNLYSLGLTHVPAEMEQIDPPTLKYSGEAGSKRKKQAGSTITVGANEEHELTLTIEPPAKVTPGSGALFNIDTIENSQLVGGASVLLLAPFGGTSQTESSTTAGRTSARKKKSGGSKKRTSR
ncbi:MAG: hypothetical protein ACJ754_14790 [Pyrinomonadaceae bacterium]